MGHNKVTSRRIAKMASKALKSKKSGRRTKKIAGSALSQAKGKHKRK